MPEARKMNSHELAEKELWDEFKTMIESGGYTPYEAMIFLEAQDPDYAGPWMTDDWAKGAREYEPL